MLSCEEIEWSEFRKVEIEQQADKHGSEAFPVYPVYPVQMNDALVMRLFVSHSSVSSD